jgi:hypothetical protein
MMVDISEDQQELMLAIKDAWTPTSAHEEQG